MKLVRGLYNLKDSAHGCVATIGNFDGVHLGHQSILSALKVQGRLYGAPVLLVTFEPPPQEFFGNPHHIRLMRFREKYMALRELGLDTLLTIRFTEYFSQLSPEDFIRDILVGRLGIRYLMVGDNFRFGHQRAGNRSLLENLGETYDYSVSSIPSVFVGETRVSSTAIRDALAVGNLVFAQQMLGRPYSLCGRVIEGDKIGRKLGFPTANIDLHRMISPLLGIFVVLIYGLNNKVYRGVASIGNRPTIPGQHKLVLEVHIFEFNEEIYRKNIKVEFLHKLRDQETFADLESLKQHIAQDKKNAEAFFEGYKHD